MVIFGTILAPYDIRVRIENPYDETNDETTLIMQLVHPSSVQQFIWEDWINCAMGFIKGLDLAVAERPNLYPKCSLQWRTRTPVKVDLSRPIVTISKPHPELPHLPGVIRIWTGWPLFDIKVAQFEINNWMRAAGFLIGFNDVARPVMGCCKLYFRREVEKAEEGLLKILSWNCNQ